MQTISNFGVSHNSGKEFVCEIDGCH